MNHLKIKSFYILLFILNILTAYAQPTSTGCKNTGSSSSSLGYYCEAEDFAALAMGHFSFASGNTSVAIGNGCRSSGTGSMAIGNGAKTLGKNSLAIGMGVTTKSYGSTSLGYNNIDNGDSTKHVLTDPLLTLGNGFGGTPQNALTILKNGQVLIGTESTKLNAGAPPSTKLAVNGLIYTARLIVRRPTNGTFPDYVFNKNYILKPLSEVEKYINKNNHLEGIPSAREVDVKGIDVAEINLKLLEKVEELTLHMIEMKKNQQKLELTNEELMKRLKAVEEK